MKNKPTRDKEFYLKNGKLFTDKNGHYNRRMEFRKYLDKTGVLDKLTGICIDLYENPLMDFPIIEYIRKSMVIPNPDVVKMEELQKKIDEEKSFRTHLENENRNLKAIFEKNNYEMPFLIEEVSVDDPVNEHNIKN